MGDHPTCRVEGDGKDIFVIFNGVKIAKRGYPNTPQAGTWVSIEPGYKVTDRRDSIEIEHLGARVH